MDVGKGAMRLVLLGKSLCLARVIKDHPAFQFGMTYMLCGLNLVPEEVRDSITAQLIN